MITPAFLAAAYKSACLAELEALKPGNVHIFADGHGMVVADFIRSADASASVVAMPGMGVGQRILSAIEASRQVVNCNTNLGIVLLCIPVIHAALNNKTPDLREATQAVLQSLTVEDSELAFRAIAKASPAGLGDSDRHDVRRPASVTLLEAMQEARQRDRVAMQYSNGFADVFDGANWYREYSLRWQKDSWAVTAVYLGFMARFVDSHIARKHGEAVALGVQQEALEHERAFLQLENPKSYQRTLLEFDKDLKRRGLNPGTSADLTVASLLAATIENAWLVCRKSPRRV
jgi:triphosphoribosyl-dephospho-CoA synthase